MSSFEKRYVHLAGRLNEAEIDLQNFYEKGNKSAGTRARKSFMKLKKLAHEMRQDTQEIRTIFNSSRLAQCSFWTLFTLLLCLFCI